MSSKLEIEKICEWCGNRFIAKKPQQILLS